MIVVGGFYHETCESPSWDQWLGSGGRAATALTALTGNVSLKTYSAEHTQRELDRFSSSGIDVAASPSKSPVAFAYFHPLSRPVIAPNAIQIARERPIEVDGQVVLRFGFFEGDAVVRAKRAIYDPQTLVWPSFETNGSKADQLGLVLNEAELEGRIGTRHSVSAARALLEKENAVALVVKCGFRGAEVYEASGRLTHIPAYRTPRVFKIGSGDVFSAAFAHYWGVAGADPVEAADLASRSVAHYVNSSSLPIPPAHQLDQFEPSNGQQAPVLIFGGKRTLAGRWIFEEALWCLRSLGLEVVPYDQDDIAEWPLNVNSALVLRDTLYTLPRSQIDSLCRMEKVTWFSEIGAPIPDQLTPSSVVVEDFSSAIYAASWYSAASK